MNEKERKEKEQGEKTTVSFSQSENRIKNVEYMII